MKAIRIHNYGGPEVLKYEDVPRPEPKAGEVLIRVHATSVNPIDWKVREGYTKDFIPHSFRSFLGGTFPVLSKRSARACRNSKKAKTCSPWPI